MQIARMKPPNRKVLNRVILVKAGHARADGKMAASRERRVDRPRRSGIGFLPEGPLPLAHSCALARQCVGREL